MDDNFVDDMLEFIMNGTVCNSITIPFKYDPDRLVDDKSILMQAMAWCCQTTLHFPNQSSRKSMKPHGFIRQQRVPFYLVL